MIAIAVDDEKWALDDIVSALKNNSDISQVRGFLQGSAALDWAEKNTFDVAFLDIDMRGINGIQLASELRKINKKCHIIFCTGYSDYMADAFGVHANAYLIKPVLQPALDREIDYIKESSTQQRLIKIRCFGGFEILDKNGRPLIFKRRKAKEIIALMFFKNGIGLSSKDICAYIWEDDGEKDRKNMISFYKRFSDLQRALKDVDAEKLIVKNGTFYSLDMTQIEILGSEADGEYMWGYNWV